MAPRRSLKTLVSRRRRADGDEDDESVTGMDDSQSDVSVASDLDNTLDADADASELSDTDSTGAPPDEAAPAKSADSDKTGRARSKRSKHTKKDSVSSTINGGAHVNKDASPLIAQGSTATNVSTAPAGAPIVSSQPTPARTAETAADRRRREHDDYKKKRDTDPTFIPNRGNFFMHDARTPDQRGFSSFGRGRGRGRGIAQPVSSHAPPAEKMADAPWTHDLHETVNERDGPPAARQRPFQPPISNLETAARGAPTGPSRPLNFSKTTQIGSVQIRVYLPGMNTPVPFSAVPVKSHTRLPDHRPPLRRDKPVRISLPDHPVRYVFPAPERSFIFIPRALRPNQQGFGKARGSFGAYGASASRRPSLYGGSVYSQAMSMSRRSSLAREVPRDSAFSPTGSYTARGSGRPVVRLPQAGSHRSSNPSPAGSASAYGRSYPHSYPRPQTPAVEHWAEPDTVHQPRPQKTISMTGIESPAGLALHAPQQQEEQPFHNQLPQHMAEGSISTQSVSSDIAPPSLGPSSYMYSNSTPLSNIPERAIHAQPFQPPASNFYQPFAPSGYYYPGQTHQYAAMPSYAPPAAQPGFMPADAPTQLASIDPQQSTMAHESNGMVYYTQVPQYAPHESYLQPQSYAVPGMGGMMTPSPEGAYYYPPAGAVFYPQAQ